MSEDRIKWMTDKEKNRRAAEISVLVGCQLCSRRVYDSKNRRHLAGLVPVWGGEFQEGVLCPQCVSQLEVM